MDNKLNLPKDANTNNADEVTAFYDEYYAKPLSYPSNDVDAVVGFFESKKFDKSAAVAVASILLKQAKLDGVKVFEIIDTLKGLNGLQLSSVVTEVMNANRDRVSTIGFKVPNTIEQIESRNIIF